MVFVRDFNNRDRGRGGGGRDFGRRDFGRPQEMFKTICSNCGKDCEVPFKPNGSKPVYCRDCYATMGGGAERRDDRSGFRRDDRRDERGGDRPQFRRSEFDRPQAPMVPQRNEQMDAINAKLDQILSLLNSKQAKPVAEKVVKVEKTEPEISESLVEAPATPVVKKKKRVVKDALPEVV
jgi:CxxC-x17-CxxC domain-containing protein